MLSRAALKPRRQNAPRPAWKVADAFKQWLRGRPCYLDGPDCAGKIEAAHMPSPGSKGMGTKAADCHCIPLCQHHHARHTNKGWGAIGLTRETAGQLPNEYWAAWPGRKAWEARQDA
jgi:hypothetical protein